MPLRQERDGLLIVDLGDEPQFSADIQAINDRVAAYGASDLIVSMASATLLNSAQWAALIQLRHQLSEAGKRLVLSSVSFRLQGALKISGLDRAFTCHPDLSAARAALRSSSPTQS